MPETNGKPPSILPSSPREIVLMVVCLLPAIGTYFKTQFEVDALKVSSVSHDQLATEVQTNLIGVAVREEQIRELTEAVKANTEQQLEFAKDLKAMRLEWSNYRSHR